MSDSPYTLGKLRSTLIRLEDTIIFGKSPLSNVETFFSLSLTPLLSDV